MKKKCNTQLKSQAVNSLNVFTQLVQYYIVHDIRLRFSRFFVFFIYILLRGEKSRILTLEIIVFRGIVRFCSRKKVQFRQIKFVNF